MWKQVLKWVSHDCYENAALIFTFHVQPLDIDGRVVTDTSLSTNFRGNVANGQSLTDEESKLLAVRVSVCVN